MLRDLNVIWIPFALPQIKRESIKKFLLSVSRDQSDQLLFCIRSKPFLSLSHSITEKCIRYSSRSQGIQMAH